ncbi:MULTISPECIES: ABC transporter substrate-binding protein [Klebsiella]|jgi:peptide/nickel transport system substrate-binding protein|uniref:ABC transporter substrate-binding protein n=2 Tax=Klebsiella/Raoultella group TaxID=2890311 RepID=UPI000742034A|nr:MULTISPECIES: ABC transporter substrate-binding protein [Klebsiella]MDU5892256.1 ABC transporter substrate-binding protein [Atopobium minutum]HCQ8039652.1 ABC transporter substrate-binding protein [Klebsiella quasipneumoniae subsp. quasipneumoniae]HEF8933357.1 ABC transporter substrate-binding protein [Klebsiella pneumoniae]KSY08460.1 ABC transporter substrate-binding protein [Klebsiella quasipneumoniae]MBG2629096.1 ABC transporter substrate-binding protein [Klebsiella michiganensis]
MTSFKKRSFILSTTAILWLASSGLANALTASETLLVGGPRTPESLDQEYPPTEASHEARRNIFERLLSYASKTDPASGAKVEDFSKIEGDLAESYEIAPDHRSITFHLRKGVKSAAGNEMTADDVMWTFERGWNMKATFYWYMTQILKITDFSAFQKIDDFTVKVTIPHPSLLLDRLWVNNDLGIIDSKDIKKHLTTDDPWGSRYLSSHSASFAPYYISRFSPGQEVVYDANPNYFRGPASIKRVVFREMPTSSNRLAALQAGSIDVAEWLTPREISLADKIPTVKVWKVYGNYTHRLEMNNNTPPFDKVEVRQAMNYLVQRSELEKSVYMGTARVTKSPIAEIYPSYTGDYFPYSFDLQKAKDLLAKAGYPNGFKTQIGYRTGEPIEEQLAIALKSTFAQANIDAQLVNLPSSSLVERYSKGQMPMFFIRDMAIVPDAAYSANLFINSKSMVNYSHYHNAEVDKMIDNALISTDSTSRDADMKKVQRTVIEEAPWVFLFNPGYQLAVSKKVTGFSWYTPNSNSWYDFSKK